MDKIAEGLLRGVPRRTRRSPTSTRSSSGRRRWPVRQRQERLCAVPGLGHGLDADHRVRSPADGSRLPTPEGQAPGRPALSRALWRRAWLRATLTLSPPLAWFLVIYLASLVLMLITAFWTVNPFTNDARAHVVAGQLQPAVHQHLPDDHCAHGADGGDGDGHRRARRAPVRLLHGPGRLRATQRPLFTAVLLPLWASYLARVYAWIVILQKGGMLSWSLPEARPRRREHRLHEHRDVAGVLLHLAAVHDRPGLRRARTDPRLAAGGVRRPRRAQLADDAQRRAAAGPARASWPVRSSRSR